MNILRPEDVCEMLGFSRTTLWRMEKNGDFPSRRVLSDHLRGWTEEEIQDWIESRPRVGDSTGESE